LFTVNLCFITIHYDFYLFLAFLPGRFPCQRQMKGGVCCLSFPNSGFPWDIDPFPKKNTMIDYTPQSVPFGFLT
jgi:hypothetical protein